MKKHLVLWVVAAIGLMLLAAPAQAKRPNCRTAEATATWTTSEGFGGLTLVIGTAGDDVFVPGVVDVDRLVIFGLGGNDIICGTKGDDVIVGGPGNDILLAKGGADLVEGGPGHDLIGGGRHGDALYGGPGNDVIFGGRGADLVAGGRGIDVLTRHKRDSVYADEPPANAKPKPKLDSEPKKNQAPKPKPEPEPAPEPRTTPAPDPTPVPDPPRPDSTPAPDPSPGDGSKPAGYGENLALIQNASATATERNAMIWDLYEPRSFALNDGNPNEYTPSAQLDFDDYVHWTGSQYGPDQGRGPTGGVFHVTCQFSHLAYDDPIVFPGEPLRSHLHMFFGNTHANAYSTDGSILNEGGSTCSRGELNRTSYWIPAVIDSAANVVIPDQFMVYYESYDDDWDTLQPFPEGLKMVNGDAMATSKQPDIENYGAPVANWKCGWYNVDTLFSPDGPSGWYQDTVPNCDKNQYSHIEMAISWPFCWDGVNLDSPNHQDHVVFPEAGPGFFYTGACPASHPVTLPRITYKIHFDLSTVSGPSSKLLLSSDISPMNGDVAPSGVSAHGDWFGGWNRDLIEGLVDRCILTGADCGNEHYGTPGGEQAAPTVLEARVITPDQVQEYCPYRSQWDGDLFDIAYCRK